MSLDKEFAAMAAQRTLDLGADYSRSARRDDSKKRWVLQRTVHQVRMFSVHCVVEKTELPFNDSSDEMVLRERVVAWVWRGVKGRERA